MRRGTCEARWGASGRIVSQGIVAAGMLYLYVQYLGKGWLTGAEGVSWLGELNTVVCICLDAKLAPSFFVISANLIVISDARLTR